jgi:hypothetical protein
MHLTGWARSAPLVPRADVLGAAGASASEIEARTAVWGRPLKLDVPTVLFARAASAGLQRAGRISAGGTCRLLEAGDGWVAINMARQDDVDSVPALLGCDVRGGLWEELATAATATAASAFVDRARLLGIPAAVVGEVADNANAIVERFGEATPPTSPLLVDLSTMWAGPLCARLLGDAGARVVKVESRNRPDGARAGDVGFYDWLHTGHESVALDFEDPSDLRALHALVETADVVVEGSRPRALRQLGIDAESILRNRPGVTWVSITGYGRTGANADRVAFGDDAAAAGGLVAIDADGHPVFCGDAIADPLAGLCAAEAAAASVGAGGGFLVSVSLAGVAAGSARFGQPMPAHEVTATGAGRWVVRADGDQQEVLPPPPLPAAAAAAALGADTRSVLSALAERR